SRSCRPTSTAFAPRNPVRNKIAMSSASVRASTPRASSFSRGRSSCGISRILSGDMNQNVGAALVPRFNLDPQLIEHFRERLTQGKQRVRVCVGRKWYKGGLRFANQVGRGG